MNQKEYPLKKYNFVRGRRRKHNQICHPRIYQPIFLENAQDKKDSSLSSSVSQLQK